MDIEKLELTEHEYNILLYMKHDRGFCAKMCACLHKKHFTSSIIGKIFHISKEFFKAHGEFPSQTSLLNYLNKTGEDPDKYFPLVEGLENEEAFDALSSGDRKFITTTVLDFTKHAKMKEAIIESYDLLAENKFGEINQKIQEALKFNIDVDLGIDLFDVDERYMRLKNSIGEKISTGFPNFDDILGGGFCRKEIYCVLGPPGMGKSIFLPNLGLRALRQGHNVVHYSLEMSEERVGLRYDGPFTQIDLKNLAEREADVKKKYQSFMPYFQNAHLKIKEFPTGAASVLDIESHLEQLRTYENFVPDVIIVDYGDIMKASRKTSNTYEEQGWIFRELRGLAIEHDCVVITATQARRDAVAEGGGTKASVGMDQVADSMEKVRILDGLFSIVQSVTEKSQRIIKLYVAKNRNGASGNTISFSINYDNMLLESSEKSKGPSEDGGNKENLDDDVDMEDMMSREIKSMPKLGQTADDFDAKFNAPAESTNIVGTVIDEEDE